MATELGIINLKWENPESNLIKKIKIVAGEDYEYISENIISEYTFENMPIKGYSNMYSHSHICTHVSLIF